MNFALNQANRGTGGYQCARSGFPEHAGQCPVPCYHLPSAGQSYQSLLPLLPDVESFLKCQSEHVTQLLQNTQGSPCPTCEV